MSLIWDFIAWVLRSVADWASPPVKPAKPGIGPPPEARPKAADIVPSERFPKGVVILAPASSGLLSHWKDECWFGVTMEDMAAMTRLLAPLDDNPEFIHSATRKDASFVERIWTCHPTHPKATEWRADGEAHPPTISAKASSTAGRGTRRYLNRYAEATDFGNGNWHLLQRVEQALRRGVEQQRQVDRFRAKQALAEERRQRARALFDDEEVA